MPHSKKTNHRGFSSNDKRVIKELIDIEMTARKQLMMENCWVVKEVYLSGEEKPVYETNNGDLDSVTMSKNKERVLRYMYNNNKTGANKALDKYKAFVQEWSADNILNDDGVTFVGIIKNDNNTTDISHNDSGINNILNEMMKQIKWFEYEINKM